MSMNQLTPLYRQTQEIHVSTELLQSYCKQKRIFPQQKIQDKTYQCQFQ